MRPQQARARHRGRALTEDYAGVWKLTRTIVDTARREPFECSGTATLQRAEARRLRYDEAVIVHVGERPIRATQTYFYDLCRGDIVATFADGRPFFTTRVGLDGIATATHRCGPDLYVGTLCFLQGERWETRWDVSGSKSLSIVTAYERPHPQ